MLVRHSGAHRFGRRANQVPSKNVRQDFFLALFEVRRFVAMV